MSYRAGGVSSGQRELRACRRSGRGSDGHDWGCWPADSVGREAWLIFRAVMGERGYGRLDRGRGEGDLNPDIKK